MKLLNKLKDMSIRAICVTVGLLIGLYAISWLIGCGLIFLICACFGWEFSWAIATGIWLIMCVVKSLFGKSDKK